MVFWKLENTFSCFHAHTGRYNESDKLSQFVTKYPESGQSQIRGLWGTMGTVGLHGQGHNL